MRPRNTGYKNQKYESLGQIEQARRFSSEFAWIQNTRMSPLGQPNLVTNLVSTFRNMIWVCVWQAYDLDVWHHAICLNTVQLKKKTVTFATATTNDIVQIVSPTAILIVKWTPAAWCTTTN